MFGAWSFGAMWDLVTSSFSIANVVGGAAAFVAVAMPKQLDWITDLRKWAIVVAVIAFGYSGVSAHHYGRGLAFKQSEWDDARAAAGVAKVEHEANVANKAAAQDQRDSAAEDVTDKSTAEERNGYIADLEKRAGAVCRLDADTARRMQAH